MRQYRDAILITLTALAGILIGFGIRNTPSHSERVFASASTAAQGGDLQEALHPAHAPVEADQFTSLVSALRGSETLAGRADLFHLIAALSVSELPSLIDRATNLPLKYRKELVSALFERWMVIDRVGAESWIRRQGNNPACYLVWARIDPQAALDHIFTAENYHSHFKTISEALTRLAGEDRRARLDILLQYPSSPASRDNLRGEFQQWSASDPASALSWLSVLPDDKFRKELVERTLIELAKKDPEAAMKRVQEMVPESKATVLGNEFISSIAQSLAEKDPTLAMQFAGQLPDDLKLYPLIAAGSAWAKSDAVAALEWAVQSGIDPCQQFRTETELSAAYMLRNARTSQPEQTIEWLLSQPEGAERDRWLQNVLFMPGGKAEGELAWKLFNSLSPEAQSRAAYGMGDKVVANADFPAMETWVSMFPDETMRARAIGTSIWTVFNKTPDRANEIVAGLPEGPVRDSALSGLVNSKAYATPTNAAVNAMEIRDPIVRYDALDSLMNSWMGRDRQSAETWLDAQTDLPQDWVTEWKTIKPKR